MVVVSIKQAFAILVVILNLSSAVLGSPMIRSSTFTRHIALAGIVPGNPAKTNQNFDLATSNALTAANLAQAAAKNHFDAMDSELQRMRYLQEGQHVEHQAIYQHPSDQQASAKMGHQARGTLLDRYARHYDGKDFIRKRKAEIHRQINDLVPKFADLTPWKVGQPMILPDLTNRHHLAQLNQQFKTLKESLENVPIVID